MGGQNLSMAGFHPTVESSRKSSQDSHEKNVEEKGNLPSHQVIFCLSNNITGPNLILMPLLFFQTGIITSVLLGIFFGYIGYKTCYLTVMHVKPNEPEFLFAIRRVLGVRWMILYFVIVVIELWLVCIIFFISLTDTLFSGINNIANNSLPSDQNALVFNQFSSQWLAILIAIIIFVCISFRDISRLVSLSSKGEIGIIVAAFFLLYLGFKSIAQGRVNISFDTEESADSVPLFSTNGLFELIGFYSAAYLLHFIAVPILRTGDEPSKKTRNLLLSYIITGIIYVGTGALGALGIYWRIQGAAPQTIFGSYFYEEKDVFVLSIITQVAVAFQLFTVIPVINFVGKNQLFSYIWKQDQGEVVPNWAFHGWNVIFILTLLGCQILNLSPTDLMGYVGTFAGFVIMYLVPVCLHLKSQRVYLQNNLEEIEPMLKPKESISIVETVHEEEAKINPIRLNILYLGILGLGIALVIVNICIAANVPGLSNS